MAIELLLERRPFGLVPTSPADQQELSIFPIGAVIKAKLVRGKSKPMFRFYWKLIQLVGDGTGIGKVPLSKELLIRTGYVNRLMMLNGDQIIEPMSISEMDFDTFRSYFEAAIHMVCAEYVSIPRNKLLREAGMMAGLTYDEAFAQEEKKNNGGSIKRRSQRVALEG